MLSIRLNSSPSVSEQGRCLMSCLLLWSAALALSCGNEQPDRSAVFAEVNGETIPQSDFDFMINLGRGQGFGRSGDAESEFARSTEIAKDLLLTKILAQEAIRSGLADREKVRAELKISRDTLLAQLLVQDFMSRIPLSESDLQAAYLAMPDPIQYRVAIYHVADEEEANDLLASIEASAGRGGARSPGAAIPDRIRREESPWVPAEGLDPAVLEAVTPLTVGQFTARALTDPAGGLRLVQLLDRQEEEKPSFEDMREIVHSNLMSREIQKRIERLAREAHVETSNELGMMDDWYNE